jgi:hypothetical protein
VSQPLTFLSKQVQARPDFSLRHACQDIPSFTKSFTSLEYLDLSTTNHFKGFSYPKLKILSQSVGPTRPSKITPLCIVLHRLTSFTSHVRISYCRCCNSRHHHPTVPKIRAVSLLCPSDPINWSIMTCPNHEIAH